METLPSVEITCSNLEQEEAQKEVLGQTKEETEGLAMFSKVITASSSNIQSISSLQCGACEKIGHGT